ncbi:MAG: thiamine pyrophosphate-dependent enzyme, partial [Rikenellaceae bacterium]
MKKAIMKSYGKKGENIVNMNYQAVDAGAAVEQIEVDPSWASLEVEVKVVDPATPAFVRDIVEPINSLEGDSLPVSAFNGREDGTWDNGTAAYEKRGIAASIPMWLEDNCIQCNQCAYVCPHAAIRPFLLDETEAANAPEGTPMAQGKGPLKAYQFKLQVSPLDCTGCGNCANICPAPNKALAMKPLEPQLEAENARWNYMHGTVGYKSTVVDKTKTVKNLQFEQPLFEFSGACAGCGETPYIKAITQLFGDRMMVANATGCSSIYGGSAPSTPYCTNSEGQGPAWANSLFEDNAEFGMGMNIGSEKLRDRLEIIMSKAIESCTECSEELKAAFAEWIAGRQNGEASKAAASKIIPMAEACDCSYCKEIVELKDYLVKRSQWIFGGDGWAYDIGYGGLDHVLASGENVNVLVMDTEVYSNTGGQSSKSTPIGAVAKFASSGKRIRKKDLGMMAVSYGYVYVAQVAMGANHAQYLQAIKEAEAYDGPSLIIAYSPCINHGIKGGMGISQLTEKKAVECGYWHMWRFNPSLESQGKNPFSLDSKAPDWSKFQAFIGNEVRYTSLLKAFPAEANELFQASQENAQWRYKGYVRMSKLDYSAE